MKHRKTFPKFGLTTPNQKGDAVKDLQILLRKNRFGQDFMPKGYVDGIYGPATAAAVRRAKYWAGFHPKNINSNVFPSFVGMLVSRPNPLFHRLPPANAARRRVRLRRRDRARSVLEIAMEEVGTKENPAGSNVVKYSTWYKMIGPWCAMYVSWCYVKSRRKFRYAYVPYIVHDARRHTGGLRTTNNPSPGDVVCYQFGSEPDHVGIFIKWIDSNRFHAVEGNTSLTSDDDGGAVMVRERSRGQVCEFVKVG